MEKVIVLLVTVGGIGRTGGLQTVMDKETGIQKLHFRVRFEYRFIDRSFRLFRKLKDLKQEAAAIRRKKADALQQAPKKGIDILEVDPNYTVYLKEEEGQMIAYAPVEVLFDAESLEDAVSFLMSEDFVNVELIFPDHVALSPREFERFIEKINDELKNYRTCLEIRNGPGGNSYILRDLPMEDTSSENTSEEIMHGEDSSTDTSPESTEEIVPDEGPSHLKPNGNHQNSLEETEPDPDPTGPSGSSIKKTLRLEWELEIIAVLSLILAGLIALGGQGWLYYLRVGLGLPFVLFFPGYVLIAALFPKKDDLDGIERVALSFGLSIAVVPLIGLGLNYTPWGIRLTPVLISLIIFILLMGSISFFRREKLPQEDRFCPTFEFEVPIWREQPVFDKVLSIALIAAILFAVGSICYVVAMPKVGEKFTEFYILGLDGKAEGYPRELEEGEKGEVIVGVVNHEYQKQKYFIEVKMDDVVLPREGPIGLEHEKKWESTMTFSYPRTRENLKVEFLLYREGDEEPYRSLHLWVDVQEKAGG